MRSTLLRISCTAQLLTSSCLSPSLPAPDDHYTCIRRLPSSSDEFLFCRRALTSSDKSEASFAPLCHDPQPNVTERHLLKIDHKRLRYQLTKLTFCSAFAVCQLERILASFHWRFSHKLRTSCPFPFALIIAIVFAPAYGKFGLGLILDRNRLWAQLPFRKKLSHHFWLSGPPAVYFPITTHLGPIPLL